MRVCSRLHCYDSVTHCMHSHRVLIQTNEYSYLLCDFHVTSACFALLQVDETMYDVSLISKHTLFQPYEFAMPKL